MNQPDNELNHSDDGVLEALHQKEDWFAFRTHFSNDDTKNNSKDHQPQNIGAACRSDFEGIVINFTCDLVGCWKVQLYQLRCKPKEHQELITWVFCFKISMYVGRFVCLSVALIYVRGISSVGGSPVFNRLLVSLVKHVRKEYVGERSKVKVTIDLQSWNFEWV